MRGLADIESNREVPCEIFSSQGASLIKIITAVETVSGPSFVEDSSLYNVFQSGPATLSRGLFPRVRSNRDSEAL